MDDDLRGDGNTDNDDGPMGEPLKKYGITEAKVWTMHAKGGIALLNQFRILVTLNCFRKSWQMAIWIKCTMIMEPSASTRCSSGSSQRLASRDSTRSLP